MEGDAKLQEAGCIHFFKRSFKGSSHDDAPAPKVGAQKYQQDVAKRPFYPTGILQLDGVRIKRPGWSLG